jgi:hypothetical protein
VALALLLTGCMQGPGRKEYVEITRIPLSDEGRILEKFSAYPVEKQIDIYIFSQCCVEGNIYPFDRYLAVNGEMKLPGIIRRIDSDENFSDKVYLLDVVETIDTKCHCVNGKPDFIDILQKNERPIDEHDSSGTVTAKELYRQKLLRIKEQK